MAMLKVVISFLALTLVAAIEGESEYYWRTWVENAPEDAVIAGADSKGLYYIAKAWLPDYGLYIGQIYNYQNSVIISWSTTGNNASVSSHLEVLCSDTVKNPIWHASSSTITPQLLTGTAPVKPIVGGKTSYYSMNDIYIGKILQTSTGSDSIGSVHTDYYLYYVDGGGVGHYSANYEILVVKNDPSVKLLDNATSYNNNDI